MAPVISLCADSVDVPHAPGQVSQGSMHQEMIAIGHQTVSADPDIPQLDCLLQQGDKSQVVLIVLKHTFTTAAAIHHMMPGARKFYA